jgi:hypothetical protein
LNVEERILGMRGASMLNLIQAFKTYNRKRIQNRRNLKFQNALSNDFDRDLLQVENIRKLITSQSAAISTPTSKVAIYSTYMGKSNNKTFKRRKIDKTIDHYFISNNRQILDSAQEDGWHCIELNLPESGNRILSAQQSKIAKALPHLFPQLNQYDYSLYVDDKIDFNSALLWDWIPLIEAKEGMIMIRCHPDLKNNVLNEFATSMIQARYQAQKEQMAEYISRKVDQGYQLRVDKMYWTSAILRNMKHPRINEFNEFWYDEIVSCGIECQISFDFVAQKYSGIMEMPQIIN